MRERGEGGLRGCRTLAHVECERATDGRAPPSGSRGFGDGVAILAADDTGTGPSVGPQQAPPHARRLRSSGAGGGAGWGAAAERPRASTRCAAAVWLGVRPRRRVSPRAAETADGPGYPSHTWWRAHRSTRTGEGRRGTPARLQPAAGASSGGRWRGRECCGGDRAGLPLLLVPANWQQREHDGGCH
jgi:hypothetical protein